MLPYFSRVAIRFVWWRDLPIAVWFALFGPRDAGLL